jgi:acyl-CoA thioester hydrolase
MSNPPGREPLVVTLTLPLRWSDTDGLGHIYHGTHVSLIEEVRTAWLNAATSSRGIWPHVVVHISIDFRSALALSQGAVEAECVGLAVGRSSVRTKEVLRSTDGTVVAESESVVVAWNDGTAHSRQLTQTERRAFEGLLVLG